MFILGQVVLIFLVLSLVLKYRNIEINRNFYLLVPLFIYYLSGGTNLNKEIRIIEFSVLLLIAYSDFKTHYIEVIDVFILFVVEFIFKIKFGQDIIISLKVAFLILVIYFFIYKFTKSLGEGDLYLGFVSGFFAKSLYEGFLIFRNTYFIGAIVSLILLSLKLKTPKDEIAFCPYMAMSIIVVILCY